MTEKMDAGYISGLFWDILQSCRSIGLIQRESFDIVLALFALKRISDRSLDDPDLPLKVPSDLFPSVLSPDIGRFIFDSVHMLMKMNPSFKGWFEGIEFPQNHFHHFDNTPASQHLINRFIGISFRNKDVQSPKVFADAILKIFNQMGQSKEMDDWLIISEQALELSTKILNVSPGQSVYGPFSGNGADLIALKKYTEDIGLQTQICGDIRYTKNLSRLLYGLLFAGIFDLDIRGGELITSPRLDKDNRLMTFDRIFGMVISGEKGRLMDFMKNDSFGRFILGPPTGSLPEMGYIQAMFAQLKNEGIMVVMSPISVLFAQSGAEVRKNLIKADLLEAVIKLPAQFGSPASVISFCLLIICRGKPKEKSGSVLFIDASDLGEKKRRQMSISSQGMDRILHAVNMRTSEDGFSRVVSADEIEEQQFSLEPLRYIINEEVESEPVDLPALREKFQIAEKKRAIAYENLIENLKAIESLTISDSHNSHIRR